MRDTGTTTSSLILPGAMERSAGDSARRAAHSRSRAAPSVATSSSSRPSPPAASASACSASGRDSGSPSASTSSIAPASGTSLPLRLSRASEAASMNSSMAGTCGWHISRDTAAAAATASR